MKTHLITLLFLFTLCTAHAQIQLGDDIDGEAADDWSGFSVSISSDGSRVAVGAIYNDGNGTDAGHVRIYEWTGSNWLQLGIDIDGEAALDYSGCCISLSSDGNRVAIGAYGNGTTNAGYVRVYEWTGSIWAQMDADIVGEAAGDESGHSVSLSSDGSRIAIGAPYNTSTGTDAGHVRVYQWTGSTWAQMGIDIDGEAANNLFGWSVSLSSDGNRVAIGAPYNSENDSIAGHVRVYEWTGSV